MRGTLPSGTIDAIVECRFADPFAVLGLHESDGTLFSFGRSSPMQNPSML